MRGIFSVAVFGAVAFTAAFAALPQPQGAEFDYGAKFTVSGYAAGKPALSGFPVLVRIQNGSPSGFSYDDLQSKSTGDDIAFIDMSGGGLPFEIDTWNPNGTSLIWVRLPMMTNGTEFVMCWGSTTSGKTVCNNNPWSDYVGVWHLGETTAGATTVSDSSGNGLSGTTVSSSSAVAVSNAKIGGARHVTTNGQNSPGIDSGITVDLSDSAKRSAVDGLGTSFCASMWVRVTADFNYFYLIGRKNSDGYQAWGVQTLNNTTGQVRYYSAGTGESDCASPTLSTALAAKNQWHKIDFCWKSDGTYVIYQDGANKLTGDLKNKDAAVQGSLNLSLGGALQNGSAKGGRGLNGDLDEVRLRAFVPDDNWAAADYATQSSESFLSVSAAEELREKPDPAAELSVGSVQISNAVATTTEVMVFFDAEDYTSDRPNDALRDLCNLFHDEGFVVHIALAGYLAHEIERYGRMDVVEAMRPHLIGTQSMYHSLHPNIMEMSDGADYAAAYARVYKQEKEAIELIRRVTGRRPFFAVPPGASKSYVAMDVYSDLGIKFYCDTVCARDEAGGDWFLGMRQFPYSNTFWIEALIPGQEGGIAGGKDDVLGINWTKALNELASRPRQIIFLHPCMAVNAEFWDSVNFMKGNFCEFGKWNVPRRRSAADTELYYARIRELLRRIKADGRFALATLSEKAATERHRSAIKRNDMSGFGALRCTGVYSVADVFQAAVAFLRDDSLREFRPGRTYGFLEKPYAIDRSVALKTIDLRESAGRIDLSRHIPASIDVGGTRIGPGDFLVAALKALNGGPAPSKCPESVTISPSDPLADLDQFPRLRDFHPAGTWVFWPEYKDEFTSDRLRWQLWTWRRE